MIIKQERGKIVKRIKSKKSRALFMFLAILLVCMSMPAFHGFASGNTVNVTVHYHREDGNYQDNDVWVGNFGGQAAVPVGPWADDAPFGRVRTFAVSDVGAKEYIAFELLNDSVFQNDLRYFDPSEGTEVWLVDGDARAFGAPRSVGQNYVTARDGVRYMALQGIYPAMGGLPGQGSSAPTRGRDNFTLRLPATKNITAGSGNGNAWLYADGRRKADDPADQRSFYMLTMYRDAAITNAAHRVNEEGVLIDANPASQGDWLEIAPELGVYMFNYTAAVARGEYTTGPYAGNNQYGGSRNVYESEVTPLYHPIDIFFEKPDAPNPATDGYTYVSLKSLDRMLGTVMPIALGKNVYMMPQKFTAYDVVQDYTGAAGSVGTPEMAGFTAEGVKMIDDYVRLHADASDGVPMGISVTRYGKMIYNGTYGDATKYDPSDATRGQVLPKNERSPATKSTLFDLASNTKMYGCNLAIEQLVSQGKLDLDTRLRDMPGWENFVDSYTVNTGFMTGNSYRGTGKDNARIRNILTHTGGLVPDPEYMDRGRAGLLYFQYDNNKPRAAQVEEFIDIICKTPLVANVGASYNYSDVDFMILGILIEQITGDPLDVYMENMYKNQLGITHTVFNPLQKGFTVADSAASELNGNMRDGWRSFGYDDAYTPANIRDYMLRGEVHDEKSWYALGGAAGHAGLFSTPGDLSVLFTLALNGGVYNGNKIFDRDVHQQFVTPAGTSGTLATSGLGWRMSNRSSSQYSYFYGASTMGTYGHQGWTGTISVVDPVYGIATAMLHSRISPVRSGTASSFNNFVQYDLPITGSGNYAGFGAYYMQNFYAYGALQSRETKIKEWTVSFETNISASAAPQLVRDGNYAAKPIIANPGFDLAGWYQDSAFALEWDFDNDRVMEGLTLYAKWEAEGGSGGTPPTSVSRVAFIAGGAILDIQEYSPGETAAPIAAPSRIFKEGNRFDGWYADAGFTTEYDFGTALAAGDISLYAKLTPVYTVSFDTNYGSYIWPQYAAAGEKAVRPAYDPKKFGAGGALANSTARVGQRFDGWYTDNGTFAQLYDFDAPITGDITLYAKWTHTWYVIFNVNGGTPAPASQAVIDGGVINPVNNPTKAGFTFAGWHYDTSCNVPFSQTDPIWTNTVLQAKWVANISTVAPIAISGPAIGAEPQAKLPVPFSGGVATAKVGYVGTVAWYDVDTGLPVSEFEGLRTYKAVVELTSTGLTGSATPSSSGPIPTLTAPKELYYWDTSNIPVITVNGQTVAAQVTGGNSTGNVLSFEFAFPTLLGDIDIVLFPDLYEGDANVAAGAPIATFSALGGEAPYTYGFSTGTGDDDNNLFVIDGDELKAGAAALTAGDYSIRVIVTDNESNVIEKVFTVTVGEQRNQVLISGPDSVVSGAGATASYTISTKYMSPLSAIDFEITVDGSFLSSKEFTLGSGFTRLSDANYGTELFWTNAGDIWTGKAILYYPASGGISGDFDILTMVFDVAGGKTGFADVTLSYAVTSYEGAGIGSVITNGTVSTEFTKWYSPFDLNKDGVVDLNDITFALQYLPAYAGDSNWDEAKIADVNNDGKVDIGDLSLILANYTVPYYY